MTDVADDVATPGQAETAHAVFDDLFHQCAWAAYLDVAAERRDWPDSEATRQRAFAHYEAALRARGRRCRHFTAATEAAGRGTENGNPVTASNSISSRASTASMRSTLQSPSPHTTSDTTLPASQT